MTFVIELLYDGAVVAPRSITPAEFTSINEAIAEYHRVRGNLITLYNGSKGESSLLDNTAVRLRDLTKDFNFITYHVGDEFETRTMYNGKLQEFPLEEEVYRFIPDIGT